MKRRISATLAVAALLAGGITGVLSYSPAPTLARGQPMDEVEFDRASWPAQEVASGLEIISGNDRAMAPGSQTLAGFNSTKVGTEMVW